MSPRERLLTCVSSFCEKELQKSSALIPPTRLNRNFEDGGLVLKLKLSKVEIEEDEDIFEWFYTSAQKNRLLPAV